MGDGMGISVLLVHKPEGKAMPGRLVCREPPAWVIAGLLAPCPTVPGDAGAGDGQHQPKEA